MSIKRGFTLTEILVVAGVLLLSLTLWLYVYRSSSSTNQDLSVDQEYYSLYSLLLSRIKIDLRSAVELKKVDDSTYSIKAFGDPKNGIPVERTIIYKLSGNGKMIERNDGQRTSTFDFSTMKGGGTFVFKILP